MQNAATQTHIGYQQSSASVRTPRNTEFEAFTVITRELASALDIHPNNPSRLANSIHQNRRLWGLLAASVAEEQNELPNDLRARIFSLAEFVRVQSSRVLANRADGKILIEINQSIMQGLDRENCK